MTDELPDSLVRFQAALDEATRRDLAGTTPYHHRKRVRARLLVAAGVTGAAALGAVSLVANGPSSTAAPAAAAVIHNAEAALASAPGTILHIRDTVIQDNGDGTTVSWTQDTYDEQGAPYDSRMINVQLPGTPAGTEQATVNGVPQIYDPTRNTIFIGPQPSTADRSGRASQYRFTPGPTPGTYRVHVPVGAVGVKRGKVMHPHLVWRTLTVSRAQAKALRDGADYVKAEIRRDGSLAGRLQVAPTPHASSGSEQNNEDRAQNPFSANYRQTILALLRSGHARVAGHSMVRGRDTIEIQSADGHTRYYVAPRSYQPVEVTTRGTTGGTTMYIDTDEQLPLAGNSGLLSLTAQHPTATIDRQTADYNAASARLFPNG